MSAAIYTTAAIYAGDTWPGIPAIAILVNGEIPSDPVTSAKLIFFKAEDGPTAPVLTLESPAAIDVVSADGWELAVPPIIHPLGPGEWTFRFSTTAGDAFAIVRTWITGTLTIL